jgi:hypothetical protein
MHCYYIVRALSFQCRRTEAYTARYCESSLGEWDVIWKHEILFEWHDWVDGQPALFGRLPVKAALSHSATRTRCCSGKCTTRWARPRIVLTKIDATRASRRRSSSSPAKVPSREPQAEKPEMVVVPPPQTTRPNPTSAPLITVMGHLSFSKSRPWHQRVQA